MRTRNWMNPRALLFALALLSCLALASAQSSSSAQTETPIDSRFGSASADLARKFQEIKRDLPHDKIPTDPDTIKEVGDWGPDYGISLAKVVGPGFAISILSLLGGILYGIFKLCRMCCCPRKDEDDDDDDRKPSYYIYRQWVPTGIYFIAFAFLVTGMVFGIMNNPRFSDGVVDLGNYVLDIGQNAMDLADGLLASLEAIVNLIPAAINDITDQIAGVPSVADNVVKLGDDVNSTSTQVSAITAKVAAIDSGNTTAVDNLNAELASINNSSQKTIDDVSDLTYQIADKLRTSLDNALTNLDEGMNDISEHVDEIEDAASGVRDDATKLVDDLKKYVDMTKDYDDPRQKAVTALFSLVITVSVSFFVGYFIGVKLVLNIVSAFGFAFLFLLWLSGSIHFLLGMALGDVCPVVDVVIQGLLPDGQAAYVLRGCLYEHRSVLTSLNITAFNLTDVFDYKDDFNEFSDFGRNFNFSTIDDYMNSISNLYDYNLTEVANNMTAANYGWDESIIYTTLDQLNDETTPDVYTLEDYMDANPNNYPDPARVSELQDDITNLLQTNATIYNRLQTAQTQLIDAQGDIDNLLANYTEFDARYSGIRQDVQTLSYTNITNVISIIDGVQANISNFFELGNCSAFGDTYHAILTSLCGTMQPAIDLLTIAQFLAGIALIPMVIIAEVLSFRVSDGPNILKCGRNSVDEEYGIPPPKKEEPKKTAGGEKCDYATVAKRDKSRPGISATIGSSPATDSSPTLGRRGSGSRPPIQMPYE